MASLPDRQGQRKANCIENQPYATYLILFATYGTYSGLMLMLF